MQINDSPGFKVYRESTSGIENDRKATQQGVKVTAQADDTGAYTRANPGDEGSWGYTNPATSQRHDLGTYSQAIPAILKLSDSKVYPLKDKTLAIDTDYASKTQATTSSDDATKVRIGEDTSTGLVGVILTCLNHDKEEQIFFPLGGGLRVDNINTGVDNKSTPIYDVLSGGGMNSANVGHTHDFLFVYNNIASIKTDAKFYQDASKNGPLNFETGAMPTLETPSSPKYYEVKIALDAGKWKFYCVGE